MLNDQVGIWTNTFLAEMFIDNAIIKMNRTSCKETSALTHELEPIIEKIPDRTYH